MRNIMVSTVAALLISSPVFVSADSDFYQNRQDREKSFRTRIDLQLRRLCENLADRHTSSRHSFKLPHFCKAYTTPIQKPTVTLTANPTAVYANATTTLTWSSNNATTCTAQNAWSGTKSLNGSEIVALTATSTFAISCSNAAGSTTTEATVIVIPKPTPPTSPANDFLGPRITSLTISPTSTAPGGQITFSATAEDINGIGNIVYDIRYPDSPSMSNFFLRPNCNFLGSTAGTCSFSESIDQAIAPTIVGNYVIETVRITDALGNISTYYPNGTVTGTNISTHTLTIPTITNTQ